MTEPTPQLHQTTCCIVGGGPAGVVLGLLLARQGIDVMLLESHPDFDRDFRGDTIHPAVMEIMEEIGLADRLLQVPHAKVRAMTMTTPQGKLTLADLSRLKCRHPYITMLPQSRFLDFMATEAKKYPSFHLVMQANVDRLVEENGVVKGIRYRDHANNWHEVRALVTVGADGRFSRLRKLAGFEPVKTSPPMDILWFRLPKKPGDMAEDYGGGFIGRGHMLILLNRGEDWQIAYVIPKGTYKEQRAEGLDELRRSVVQLAPFLADRVGQLERWDQLTMLAVESSRIRRWYRPGLLLIGDAAHVMSPVGGVGINYAIMDAVAAANILTAPLKAGKVRVADLAKVQRQRERPTRVIQAIQAFMQRNLVARALASSKKPFRLPLFLRLLPHIPFLRDLPARIMAFGIGRVHVQYRQEVAPPFSPSPLAGEGRGGG